MKKKLVRLLGAILVLRIASAGIWFGGELRPKKTMESGQWPQNHQPWSPRHDRVSEKAWMVMRVEWEMKRSNCSCSDYNAEKLVNLFFALVDELQTVPARVLKESTRETSTEEEIHSWEEMRDTMRARQVNQDMDKTWMDKDKAWGQKGKRVYHKDNRKGQNVKLWGDKDEVRDNVDKRLDNKDKMWDQDDKHGNNENKTLDQKNKLVDHADKPRGYKDKPDQKDNREPGKEENGKAPDKEEPGKIFPVPSVSGAFPETEENETPSGMGSLEQPLALLAGTGKAPGQQETTEESGKQGTGKIPNTEETRKAPGTDGTGASPGTGSFGEALRPLAWTGFGTTPGGEATGKILEKTGKVRRLPPNVNPFTGKSMSTDEPLSNFLLVSGNSLKITVKELSESVREMQGGTDFLYKGDGLGVAPEWARYSQQNYQKIHGKYPGTLPPER